MNFELTSHKIDNISSDALLLFVFESADKNGTITYFEDFKKLDTDLNSQISKICELDKYKAKTGDILTIITSKQTLYSRIVLIGLGKKSNFTADVLRRAAGKFTQNFKNKIDSASLSIPDDFKKLFDLKTIIHAFTEGFMLGKYEFAKYKKTENERDFASVIISYSGEGDKKVMESAIKEAKLYSKAAVLARDLVNEQAAIATPEYLANIALDIAKKNPNHIICKIMDIEQVRKMGMGAFFSIAKAAHSKIPPKFIHLEYIPENKKSKKKIALVGKGITFDSGGINVKTGSSMIDMKMDMAGAAAVLGVFSVISEIAPDHDVLGLIAATPNLISADSTLPGDVAKALNGKTIEILDTDAEGRVTLADSLSYAVQKGATEIVDLATLTGAVMVALGPDISALFSNNADLARKLKSSAFEAGEKIWELPLVEEYKKMNKSDIADICNIPNTRYGGTITAALFLEEFVSDVPWAHLDIAGSAFQSKASDISPKGATGFGVRMLLNYLRK